MIKKYTFILQTSLSIAVVYYSETTSLLLRLFIEIKALMTPCLDDVLYIKEVDLSYEDFLLKSKPLSYRSTHLLRCKLLFQMQPFMIKKYIFATKACY